MRVGAGTPPTRGLAAAAACDARGARPPAALQLAPPPGPLSSLAARRASPLAYLAAMTDWGAADAAPAAHAPDISGRRALAAFGSARDAPANTDDGAGAPAGAPADAPADAPSPSRLATAAPGARRRLREAACWWGGASPPNLRSRDWVMLQMSIANAERATRAGLTPLAVPRAWAAGGSDGPGSPSMPANFMAVQHAPRAAGKRPAGVASLLATGVASASAPALIGPLGPSAEPPRKIDAATTGAVRERRAKARRAKPHASSLARAYQSHAAPSADGAYVGGAYRGVGGAPGGATPSRGMGAILPVNTGPIGGVGVSPERAPLA